MKKDILTKEDIVLLVDTFYERVKVDKIIGYIFTDVVKIHWEKHLPRMYGFWENTLFYSGTYEGNPMELHKHLHNVMPLTKAHFTQWTKLFASCVDELFKGENATIAKQKAVSISKIIQSKILSNEPSQK